MTYVRLVGTRHKSKVWKDGNAWCVLNYWTGRTVTYRTWRVAYNNAYVKTSLMRKVLEKGY